jgi:hypothetical protein
VNGIEKVALGIVAVALVTTLVMSGRQTATVIKASGDVFSGGLRTAMGR